MSIFGGRSLFGMRAGSRAPSHKRREVQVAVTVSDAEAAHNVVEFAPKPSEASATDDPRWLRRGLFKVGFSKAAPRLKPARKFTK